MRVGVELGILSGLMSLSLRLSSLWRLPSAALLFTGVNLSSPRQLFFTVAAEELDGGQVEACFARRRGRRLHRCGAQVAWLAEDQNTAFLSLFCRLGGFSRIRSMAARGSAQGFQYVCRARCVMASERFENMFPLGLCACSNACGVNVSWRNRARTVTGAAACSKCRT